MKDFNFNNNIMVTNFQDSGEDVMLFTRFASAEMVEQKLRDEKESFGEVFSVLDNEVSSYCYDPCWLTEKNENYLLSIYPHLCQKTNISPVSVCCSAEIWQMDPQNGHGHCSKCGETTTPVFVEQ